MKRPTWTSGVVICCALLSLFARADAPEWPQWRGPNRDAKATFEAPAAWPKELKPQWDVEVGDGVATPALVGGKLYVFTRQGPDEIIRCLDAATGKELWQSKYAAQPATGAASSYAGPRSSPSVAEGKVVTLGVRGVVSCLAADSGKLLWRKDDYQGAVPQFFTGSSPLIIKGMCLVQLGGDRDNRSVGGMIAYDLTTGDKKWEWKGDAPGYSSPALVNVSGEELVLMPTARKMVALRVNDGSELWSVNYQHGRYNSASPVVADQLVMYAAQTGIAAEKLEKKGDQLETSPVWTNKEQSLIYNTPVLKDGWLYGITRTNDLFCIDAETGKTAWAVPVAASQGGDAAGGGAKPAGQDKGPPGKGGGRGKRGGGGRPANGYGSVVDAGSVLFALSPVGQLVVFEPSGAEFKEIARYQVAQGGTFAHPVIAGKQIFIKDADSVMLYSVP